MSDEIPVIESPEPDTHLIVSSKTVYTLEERLDIAARLAAGGFKAEEVARKMKISVQTVYRWNRLPEYKALVTKHFIELNQQFILQASAYRARFLDAADLVLNTHLSILENSPDPAEQNRASSQLLAWLKELNAATGMTSKLIISNHDPASEAMAELKASIAKMADEQLYHALNVIDE